MAAFDVRVRFTGVMSKTIYATDKQEALKKMEAQIEESIHDVAISDVQFSNSDIEVNEIDKPKQ